jgi:hypothetical protein
LTRFSDIRLYKVTFCNLEGVVLTHKHPILHDNEWQYPKDIVKSYKDSILLYNFQMKGDREDLNSPTIIVNNITCATLGCDPRI